jgi:hypothetical protein
MEFMLTPGNIWLTLIHCWGMDMLCIRTDLYRRNTYAVPTWPDGTTGALIAWARMIEDAVPDTKQPPGDAVVLTYVVTTRGVPVQLGEFVEFDELYVL